MVRNSKNCGPQMFSVKALLTFAVLRTIAPGDMEHIARGVQRQQALQQVALQQCYDLLLNVQNRYSPCLQHGWGRRKNLGKFSQ